MNQRVNAIIASVNAILDALPPELRRALQTNVRAATDQLRAEMRDLPDDIFGALLHHSLFSVIVELPDSRRIIELLGIEALSAMCFAASVEMLT